MARAILVCKVDGCDKSGNRRGLCNLHRQRVKNGTPLNKPAKLAAGSRAAFVAAALASSTDDCIEWPYSKLKGYGRTSFRGRGEYAHRAVCVLSHGEPSPGLIHAAHSCGNPGCVNPRHLRWATPPQNSADRRIHGTHHEGEKVNGAKLSRDDVAAIRGLLAKGAAQRDIADKFGVSQSEISHINSGIVWGWLQ